MHQIMIVGQHRTENHTRRSRRWLRVALWAMIATQGAGVASQGTIAVADHPHPIERSGRVIGIGWGDGYHACASSGIRLGADLPPQSFADRQKRQRLVTGKVARQIGHTFYDHFDAHRLNSGCESAGVCDAGGCDASAPCDDAPRMIIRDSQVLQLPAASRDATSPVEMPQPIKSTQADEIARFERFFPDQATPAAIIAKAAPAVSPTITPPAAPTMTPPVTHFAPPPSVTGNLPLPKPAGSAKRYPIRPTMAPPSTAQVTPVIDATKSFPRSGTPASISPVHPQQRSVPSSIAIASPSNTAGHSQVPSYARGGAGTEATPSSSQPQRLGSNTPLPVRVGGDRSVKPNPFAGRPVVKLAERSDSEADVVRQPR